MASFAREASKARALYAQTTIHAPRTTNAIRTIASDAQLSPHVAQTTATTGEATPEKPIYSPASAALQRRRHMPSSPQQKPIANSIRFIISTKSEYHGQTEIERHFHGALTCLHDILGDVPYGRAQNTVSRTPLQMLPRTDADCRGSMLAFKVFNASREQRERIERELRALPGIDNVKCDGPASTAA